MFDTLQVVGYSRLDTAPIKVHLCRMCVNFTKKHQLGYPKLPICCEFIIGSSGMGYRIYLRSKKERIARSSHYQCITIAHRRVLFTSAHGGHGLGIKWRFVRFQKRYARFQGRGGLFMSWGTEERRIIGRR